MFNDIFNSSLAGVFLTIPTQLLMAAVYVEYTSYDGTDALMARKLMQLGIPVTVGSVENYRRLLLEQKGLETDTFEHYLAAIASEKKREEKQRKNQGLARHETYGSAD